MTPNPSIEPTRSVLRAARAAHVTRWVAITEQGKILATIRGGA